MASLFQGDPAAAHTEYSCTHCSEPLYSAQPMSVPDCPARALRRCDQVCRPDEGCSSLIGAAMHVGCALLAARKAC